MAESGERRSKIPNACKQYAQELVTLNTFLDEVYDESTKNNFESLIRLFDKLPCEEESTKTEEKYVELESLLKYLLNVINGYDEQITSINNHLEKIVENISI